ncbi:MAG: carboxypeptidase regulatory-like domain-containing protein [Acidobacteriota bacterium]
MVTDKTGGVIANAEVTAIHNQTNLSRTVRSDANGQYDIEFLPVGDYTIRISTAGFSPYVRSGVLLELHRVARVDAVLTAGGGFDAITVVGDAVAVNMDTPSIGRTFAASDILSLPLVNRNVYTLLPLIPGIESSQNSIVLGYPEQRTKVNGSADGGSGAVAYYLDGGNNMTGLRNTGNNMPNPDAIAELAVVTNNYSSEYGRFTGAVVNVITKSGTNGFHGSVFEFLRNDKMNANVWAPGGTLPKAPLRRNQYGVAGGGPIKRNKTFFFGTWSGLRQISSTLLNTAVVPTAAERLGDFSQSRVIPMDPQTRQAFDGGRIPLTRFDPTALNILKLIPLANQPQNIYQTQIPSPYNSDEVLVKIDHNPGARWRISASYFGNSGTNTAIPIGSSGAPVGNLPWSTQQLHWHQQNASMSNTWNISPRTVDEFWVTYVRSFGGRLNLPQTSLGDLGSNFKIQGAPSLPQIGVSGYFLLGQAIAGPTAGTNNYSVRNVLSMERHGHLLKVGGEIYLNKDVQETLLNNYGVFNFSGVRTNNALADFLLGLPVTMNQDAPVRALDNSWSYGLFIQDDWRVRRNFTLNLGLRWDLQTPPTDPMNRQAAFATGVSSRISPAAPLGMLFPGDPGIPRGITPVRKRNFAPRVGFAWDPFRDGRTSIRGAAGVFYGSVSGNEWNTTSNFQPFAVRQQFNDVRSLTDPYGALPGGASPFPYNYDPKNPKFISPASVFVIDRQFAWPYTYQLNFSVQREIARGWTLTAAYVGTLARRLPFAVDINYPLASANATTANVNARRPINPGTLASILMLKSIMNSSYNGLQVMLEKRMARHLEVRGFYTFSKSLEGAQLDNNTTQGLAQDFKNLALEKGRSDFDRRHNFVTIVIFQPDYFNGRNRVLRGLTRGWTLSAVASFRSGQPFTVSSAGTTTRTATTMIGPTSSAIPGWTRIAPARPSRQRG